MRRALFPLAILVALVGSGVAKPVKKPRLTTSSALVTAADELWRRAARETDPERVVAAWEAAAVAFDHATTTLGAKAAPDVASAAVAAWQNTISAANGRTARKAAAAPADLDAPTPLSSHEEQLRLAASAYLPIAPAAERPALLFVTAAAYSRHAQLDLAIPIYREIIDLSPRAEVAEYAANLLLDALNRQRKYDELASMASLLAANTKLVAKRPELKATLAAILNASLRR